MSETMGSRIKEVRKSLKMKQNELADAVGVNYTMISLYESNKREPSRETVENIARVTNVSADYIMGLSKHKTFDKETSKKIIDDVEDIMKRINQLPAGKREKIINMINDL
ncbi:helix-turn-helix transcriptional regulator [Bacillus thuringiensis]|uniref:helix-turn-helix transcriptional regulator n=2 Tax=Bacillus thuringiensis TaxID=1428 RepID=UPI000A373481|nr:helix-turn-helix transcriptional regulator [Bacillus thuringiensis]MED2128265.1 helix-turn-helix transcriptional regulator [Bacillus thuringiensis]MED2151157.1 helix-turn-helix transcriptional regulator [Bacillus thuringiensis]MED2172576.1 helix-turn-helix transcriptional regulator [Bacillus thuringiensis]MED2473877.1 helix-turn-helix transcriptional regulator [Bacillus thuringiensis]MED2574794.1 helix-turn-helix transcriptional regulator [Bacillus thuringiensis]